MQNRSIYLVAIGGLLVLLLVLFLIPKPDKTSYEDTPELPLETVVATSTRIEIGTSVEERVIEAYTFGSGDTDILLVGGIHGGYEANTVVLAEEMVAAFMSSTILIPENITVHLIPNLNPDGYAKAIDPVTNYTDAAMRFNANGVDLNRNFDCRWSPEGTWRGTSVKTGEEPFSEPEAVALRDYVLLLDNLSAAVFWHSRANNVYGSECGGGVSDETLTLMNTYATAADYGAVPVFDAYVVTGAAEDWLASRSVPTVSVELETRTDSEYERNLAGIRAILELYSN